MAIDEKKLIEDIDNCVVGLTNIQMMQIADIIETQPKVNEWITCSKELPRDDEMSECYDTVIVTLDDGRVTCGCYRNEDKEWWVNDEDGECFSINATGHVIAWQPLQEPYKPE